MRNTSRNINLHGGVEKMDPNVSIPETWAEHSNRNIQESQSSTNFVTYYPPKVYFSSLLKSTTILWLLGTTWLWIWLFLFWNFQLGGKKMLNLQLPSHETAVLAIYEVKLHFSQQYSAAESTATPMPTSMFNTTCESFQMRYCTMFYLKGHQNCNNLKILTFHFT